MEAICIDCGVIFSYTLRKKDITRCRECFNKIYLSNWKKNNRERVKELQYNWVKNNPEKVKKMYKNWAKNNPKKLKELQNKWAKNNPDKVKVSRKKNRYTLKESYIAGLLGIKAKDCPPELIELKRVQIQLHREIYTKT